MQGPQGIQGIAGVNGRDGLDGNGLGLTIKENGQIKGIFMQYTFDADYKESVLMMLPTGEVVLVNLATGDFGKDFLQAYYTEAGCTGADNIIGPWGTGSHLLGRVYVSKDANNNNSGFFKAIELVPSFKFKSVRRFSPDTVYSCMDTAESQISGVKVEAISSLPSLMHLAPIKFSP